MKKCLLGAGVFGGVVLAGLIVFVSGCGGGGSGAAAGFNFNGVWKQNWTVVSGESWTPGETGENWATITQSGTTMTLEFPGRPALSGVCDPAAGTFSVTGNNPPQSYAVDGASTGDTTMSGHEYLYVHGQTLEMSWTMELISR